MSGLWEEDANAGAWATGAAGEEDFPVLNGELYSLSAEVPTSNAFSALAAEAEEEAADE